MIDPSEVSFVIADHFAMLRIVQKVFRNMGIPYGLLESPIETERIGQVTTGLVLMTREIASPLLHVLPCDSIYFLDIGVGTEMDHHLVRLLSRERSIPVYRFLVFDSVELPLYNHCLRNPRFSYLDLGIRDSERFLRIAVTTTQPNRMTDLPTETPLIDTVDFDLTPFLDPIENSALHADDFWETAFSTPKKPGVLDAGRHPRPAEPKHRPPPGALHQVPVDWQTLRNPEAPFQWKPKAAMDFLECLTVRGVGCWAIIAADVKQPLEMVVMLGHSILIYFLSHKPNPPPLLNAIVWLEFNPNHYDRTFDGINKFWTQLCMTNPLCQSPLFVQSQFGRQLQAGCDSYIELLEKNWILRVFMSLRKAPYLPPRYASRINDPWSHPEFCWLLLRTVLEVGTRWTVVIRQIGIEIDEKPISEEFNSLYYGITADVLNYGLHLEQEDLLKTDSILTPITMMLVKGPWTDLWTNSELTVIYNVMIGYCIPFTNNGATDWNEFFSLVQFVTKSPTAVSKFAYTLIGVCRELKPESTSEVMIDARTVTTGRLQSGHSLTIPIAKVRNLRSQLNMWHQVKRVHREGVREFRQQIELPGWDVESDRLFLNGLIQLGWVKVSMLWGQQNLDWKNLKRSSRIKIWS
jgi:hypothetical protein